MTLFRKEKKVTLTRNQALHVSFCLERLRLGYEDGGSISNQEIRKLEDILDSQIWNSEYVANRVQAGE